MYCFRFGMITLFIWFAFQVNSWSQDTGNDTLEMRYQRFPEDTTGVRSLLRFSAQSYHTDLQDAYGYASRAMEISTKIDFMEGLLLSKYYMAIFFANSDFEIAESNLLDALQIAMELHDTIMAGKIYNIAGLIKNNKKQYKEALVFFDKSLESFRGIDRIRQDSLSAAVYNNMAISYLGLSQQSQAIENYQRALAMNMASGNDLWAATNYLNIGHEYLNMGDTANALKYLGRCNELVKEKGFGSLEPYLFNAFNRYYSEKGQISLALEFARKAYRASKKQMNRLEEKQALMKLAAGYHAIEKYDSAFHYQLEINAVSDSIFKNSQTRELDVLELKYRYQKKIADQEYQILSYELDSSRKRTQITLIILGSLLLLLLLVFMVLFQRQLMKRKSLEQNALRLEKESLAREVEYKNKELTLNAMYQVQANELLKDIEKKAERFRFDPEDKNRRVWNEILSDLRANSSTKKWEDFQVSFKEVESEFYRKLHLKFPELTPNELRFAAFMKLNMSSKEISLLTYQSEGAIKTARYRLRKKFGLKRNENLTAFLNSI